MKELLEAGKNILIYGVYVPMFGLASFEKFFGGVPDWFDKQFQGTLINAFPGSIGLSFYFIALLEAVTAGLFLVSLGKREFLVSHSKTFLNLGLLLAMAVFVVLGVGLRLAHDFNGAFQIFGYFVLTSFLLSTTRTR